MQPIKRANQRIIDINNRSDYQHPKEALIGTHQRPISGL